MRKRTEAEKVTMGRIVPVLENLRIKQNTRGYAPLLDIMSYAAAYPNVEFRDIVSEMMNNNTYTGISMFTKEPENQLFPSIVRTIETAFERGRNEYLQEIGISEEVIRRVLHSENYDPEDLLEVLGEKYADYSHEERIVYYFIKKVLKYLNN